MKKVNGLFMATIASILLFTACDKSEETITETKTIDFEDLQMPSSGYWNGSDASGQFTSGDMVFSNHYNADYSTWDSYAYSTLNDTKTAGYGNQYSVYDAANNGNAFAIFYPSYSGDAYCAFQNDQEYQLKSIELCNDTYTALSMKDGDAYRKKFGGDSGNDPDWFKVDIIGFNAAGDSIGNVEFYLADYRFDDNSQDYIVNQWTRVDLSGLGKVNKLAFRFGSSDTGAYGINTPSYVCLDNIRYELVSKGE
jgi:hypothetical protein